MLISKLLTITISFGVLTASACPIIHEEPISELVKNANNIYVGYIVTEDRTGLKKYLNKYSEEERETMLLLRESFTLTYQIEKSLYGNKKKKKLIQEYGGCEGVNAELGDKVLIFDIERKYEIRRYSDEYFDEAKMYILRK